MPPTFPSTGLTITNPLVLYRALLATKRIDPDPAQHRLALHLQKLYYRLKDYQPEVDFGHRLDQINRLVKKPAIDEAEVEDRAKQNHGRRHGILSTLREHKEKADATALTRRLTSHESAVQLQSPQGLLLCKNSPAHYYFFQADREHRDNVLVLPCSPQKDKTDLEKYNRWRGRYGEKSACGPVGRLLAQSQEETVAFQYLYA